MISLLYEAFSFLSWSCINSALTTQIFVLSFSYDNLKGFVKAFKVPILLQVCNMKKIVLTFFFFPLARGFKNNMRN